VIINVCGRDVRVEGRLIRIGRPHGDKYRFLGNPEPILVGLRNCGTRVDLFTFMQRLPETSLKYSYPCERDNLAVLPVSTFEHWWTDQLDNKTRNMVRKAERKGVVLREVPFDEVLVQGIWAIYNESPLRQGKRFPHFGKDIETIRKEEATFLDSSIFIGAYVDGNLIGFVKLVMDETRTQAGLMNIVAMVLHRDKAAANALIAQAVRSCANRGISHLVYSNFAYGKKQRDSLSDFKANNGFGRIDLPRYYVPLTRVGWLAFRLGLHRRIADHLPQSIVTKARELRSAWYSHKQPEATGSS
jgi:hypothetical protein